jgi:hypothetical protein
MKLSDKIRLGDGIDLWLLSEIKKLETKLDYWIDQASAAKIDVAISQGETPKKSEDV